MLQAIPTIRHREIVRRTITKFHIVDLEDGVTKEMDTADYITNAKLNGKVKDLYRKCPAHHGHFDFDEFLEGNMLALMAIAPRRAENQAVILIHQLKNRNALAKWLDGLRLLMKLNQRFNNEIGTNIKTLLPDDFNEHQLKIKKELRERLQSARGEEHKSLQEQIEKKSKNEEILTSFELYFDGRISKNKDEKRVNNICSYHPQSTSHSTKDCRNLENVKRNGLDGRVTKFCRNHPKATNHATDECFMERKKHKGANEQTKCH
eukprot:Awhi_evm1s6792